MKVALVVPHIFMQRDILPQVIFSPGQLALDLASGLQDQAVEVVLFTPGPVDTKVPNVTAGLSYFAAELQAQHSTYLDLLKKRPLTFISLARQVQSELIAHAFSLANQDQLDLVHIYTNEEDIGITFSPLCQKPVVYTHHDPFNFLAKYRSLFPKYQQLNWLSMSLAQRQTMPADTNWVGNIYHGLPLDRFRPNYQPTGNYIAFLGRLIEPKGVHLAIQAVEQYNARHPSRPFRLKIAGKHYAGHKDTYWRKLQPLLTSSVVDYVGYIKDTTAKQAFLGNAAGLIMPSVFDEPFGLVMIEALACGTPIIGLNSGAIAEVIRPGHNGWLVPKSTTMISDLANQLAKLTSISRPSCRQDFESRFSLSQMCQAHKTIYEHLVYKNDT